MNQKQLEAKLERMHQEMLAEMKALKEALVAALGSRPGPQMHGDYGTIPFRAAPPVNLAVEMDESTFVVEVSTDTVEKGFQDNIAEVETAEDKALSDSKNKLRNLKKRT
jgi:hypothetical protein